MAINGLLIDLVCKPKQGVIAAFRKHMQTPGEPVCSHHGWHARVASPQPRRKRKTLKQEMV